MFIHFLWPTGPSPGKTTMETPLPNHLCQTRIRQCYSAPCSNSLCSLISYTCCTMSLDGHNSAPGSVLWPWSINRGLITIQFCYLHLPDVWAWIMLDLNRPHRRYIKLNLVDIVLWCQCPIMGKDVFVHNSIAKVMPHCSRGDLHWCYEDIPCSFGHLNT